MGYWVILINFHLSKTFMLTLEKKIESIEDQTFNLPIKEDFKLFI